jgi:DNA-binding protein H-NS
MKTYAAIKAEIAKLEMKAEEMRRAESAGVVARIKEAIAAYGFTAEDLGFGSSRRGRPPAEAVRHKSAVARPTVGVPKYRDPQTTKTWTGRGKPPAWIAGVADRTPFLIEASAVEAASPKTRGGTAGKRPGGRKTIADSGRASTRASRKGTAAASQIQAGTAPQ